MALIGVGGAIAVAGLACGLLARSDAQTVDDASSPTMPAPFSQVADNESRGKVLEAVSFAFYGIGGAALFTGTILAIAKELLPRRSALRRRSFFLLPCRTKP